MSTSIRSAGITPAQSARMVQILFDGMRRDIVKSMEKRKDQMVKHAKEKHRFHNITGAAEASITGEVTVQNDIANLSFYIDPANVQTSTGYNRAWILNDGTYGNYRMGAISPTARTVGGAPGTGIKHDDFMGKAWNKYYPLLQDDFRKIMSRARTV